MAFDFLKEINESVLTDNKSSIYKALGQVLELEDDASIELYGLIPLGSELGLIEILDANKTAKEDVIEYLKKIDGLNLKKFVQGEKKKPTAKSKKKAKAAKTLGLDKEVEESMREYKEDFANESINITYNEGDVVLLESGEEATILKQGPHQTYKVLINGETTMVDSKEVKEGVIGMSAVPGLKRLQELAGMPGMPGMPGAEMPAAEPVDMDAGNEDWELGGDDIGMDYDAGADDIGMADDMVDGVAPEAVDDMGVVGDDLGMDEPVVDAPIDMAPMTPDTDAYAEIQTNITFISDKLLDIRISEFKPLLGQMEDLLTDLRNRGNDALREHLELQAKLAEKSEEVKNRVNLKKK